MNKNITRGLLVVATGLALATGTSSCTNDLDQTPKYEITPDKVFVDLNGYRQVLAKLYGGFALTGQIGPNNPDGPGDIGGFGDKHYIGMVELFTEGT